MSYLDSAKDIARSLHEAMDALRPGGFLAVDVLDRSYGRGQSEPATYAEVSEEWAIFVRKQLEGPDRVVREITTYVRTKDGTWRRDDEVHRNTLVDVHALAMNLEDDGLEVTVRSGFGSEGVEGVLVLTIRKRA